jgi:hypothetical protein
MTDRTTDCGSIAARVRVVIGALETAADAAELDLRDDVLVGIDQLRVVLAAAAQRTECRSVAVGPSMLEQIKSEVVWGSEPEGVAKRLDSMIRNMTWGNAPEKWPAERKMAVWACWWELMEYSAGMVHVTLPELVAIASRVPATEQESEDDGVES